MRLVAECQIDFALEHMNTTAAAVRHFDAEFGPLVDERGFGG